MKPQEASQCCWPIDDLLDAELFKALGEPTRLKLGPILPSSNACTWRTNLESQMKHP